MRSLLAFLFIFLFIGYSSAQKNITIEDIYASSKFRTKSVAGFNFLADGKHYSELKDGNIVKMDITTGNVADTLLNPSVFVDIQNFNGKIESYNIYEHHHKILIESESEPIYRHSSKVKCHIFDTKTKQISLVFDGKVANPQLSPDGQKVAFVFNNNLYYYDINQKNTLQITQDGAKNKIINGLCDWVYEEEFGFTRAFYWSPDSEKLAFLKFDESEVPEFTMQLYNDDMYPILETFKYPKVGEKNSIVTPNIYHISTKETQKADLEKYEYIPRMKWTQDPNVLCIYKMNRHQNELSLQLFDVNTQKLFTLLEEKNKYYIDITDDLTFLKDGEHFLWSSEKGGYNQIYLYTMDGKEKILLTDGKYDVTSLYGVDETNKTVFFQAAKDSPLYRHIYSIGLDGKNLKEISTHKKGTHSAQFSSTYDFYTMTYSTINAPPSYTVYNRKGKEIRVIEDNKNFEDISKDYQLSLVEFFTFKTSENVELNGYMIKPRDFDKNKKYPVFMTQYSGPGSQQVTDGWKGVNYLWYQSIVQMGYVVVCVDGRGTGARGEEFKKMTYLQLGHYETIDQIEAAKYLGTLPYVDKSRIGIYGWSYGGYMSSLCILKGADVFKAAIAVAPVTNWKWYDNIYTERYMRTLAENEGGYRDNSPVYFADRLKGAYLLIHGMADDNVHFQHAVEMANALIKANKQFDTYYYPNRNHGIFGGVTRLHLFTKMNDFIKKNI